MPCGSGEKNIKNIMQAKKILLIAGGTKKAEALKNSLYGPITPAVPASILQLHNDVTVIAWQYSFFISLACDFMLQFNHSLIQISMWWKQENVMAEL